MKEEKVYQTKNAGIVGGGHYRPITAKFECEIVGGRVMYKVGFNKFDCTLGRFSKDFAPFLKLAKEIIKMMPEVRGDTID